MDDALDFLKLIEHTLKNDTRHPCILPAGGPYYTLIGGPGVLLT